MYIGFRVEIASRIIKDDPEDIVAQYNSTGDSRVFDLHTNGRITADKSDTMIIARGANDPRIRKGGGMINFAIMIPMQDGIERVVQIVNILGNGRLIRERVKTFTDGRSTLNQIPELEELVPAFLDLDTYAPGLINGGWYYAPEAMFDEDEG